MTRLNRVTGLAVLVVLVCGLTTAKGRQPKPAADPTGDRREIEVGPGKLKIYFRRCPIGDHYRDNDPRKSERNEREFWFAETEVSQGVFFAVLKAVREGKDQSIVQKWSGREARVEEQQYKDVMTRMSGEAAKDYVTPEYPVYCLNSTEAVLFCQALGRLLGGESRGPVTYTFRFPTAREWDYACRGRSKIKDDGDKYPYFHSWLTQKPDVTKAPWALFAEAWKSSRNPKNREDFTGSQTQVVEILTGEYHEHHTDLIKMFPDILQQALQLKFHYWLPGESELVPVNKGEENPWGIRHMHGNVAEWVLPEELTWKTLTDKVEEKKDGRITDENTKLQVRGGHFRYKNGDNLNERQLDGKTFWKVFSIGEPLASPALIDATTNGPNSHQFVAGIRLVMERELRLRDWLAKDVRGAANVHAAGAGDQTAAGQLIDNWNAGLEQLAKVEETDEKKRKALAEETADARLAVALYAAVVRGKAGEAKLAAAGLKEWLKHLRGIAAADKPAADLLEGRLRAVNEQEGDLKSATPSLWRAVQGRLALYEGLMLTKSQKRPDARVSAAASMARWRDSLVGSLGYGRSLDAAELATMHEDIGDLSSGYVAGLAGPERAKWEAALRNYESQALAQAGETAKARQALSDPGLQGANKAYAEAMKVLLSRRKD